MIHRLKHRAHSEDGFTLVELLVVILIIGILAAIALPTFLGQSAKAQDSSAKSNARNAISIIDSCGADRNADYTGCNLNGSGLENTTVTVAADGASYSVRATSASSNTFDIAKDTNGVAQRTCQANKPDAGCNGNGASW